MLPKNVPHDQLILQESFSTYGGHCSLGSKEEAIFSSGTNVVGIGTDHENFGYAFSRL